MFHNLFNLINDICTRIKFGLSDGPWWVITSILLRIGLSSVGKQGIENGSGMAKYK